MRYMQDHKLANLLLHGAGLALNDRITESDAGVATIRVGPSEQHLANGLRHAYWSYHRVIRLVAELRSRAPASTSSTPLTGHVCRRSLVPR